MRIAWVKHQVLRHQGEFYFAKQHRPSADQKLR